MWNSTETDSVRTESELWLWNAMCGLCMTRHWHLQWTWEEGTSSQVQRLTEGQFNMCVSVKFACGGKQGKGCTFSIWINRKYHHRPCILRVWLAERPQDTENSLISNYAVDANVIQQLFLTFPTNFNHDKCILHVHMQKWGCLFCNDRWLGITCLCFIICASPTYCKLTHSLSSHRRMKKMYLLHTYLNFIN